MHSVLEIIKKTTEFLAERGVERARHETELLVGHALGLKRMALYLQFERLLTGVELDRLRPLVKRRAGREPLQHILGTVEWGGLVLRTDRRALIPRPETELLLELLTARLAAPPLTVLDLGTGSGALALALAQLWPEAQVHAVDASVAALALARENAAALSLAARVSFFEGDWFTPLPADARYPLIVANPPYLTVAEVAAAEPEVRLHDPESALVAPREGLADLETIIAGAPARLAPGGWLALETGVAQHPALRVSVAAAGLSAFESVQDLTGRDRFVFARAPG
jgi:release factor glutamine methyltransferase